MSCKAHEAPRSSGIVKDSPFRDSCFSFHSLNWTLSAPLRECVNILSQLNTADSLPHEACMVACPEKLSYLVRGSSQLIHAAMYIHEISPAKAVCVPSYMRSLGA
ncbi:uncharacterized protein PV07_00380 [Cladophialophora immunda]|uniref:Uncharacterized protein n=1 Tax=Cladophialophora immunda TaxID=569365 RepID=A0A0D2CUL8_9EURO|nr:uncharacterized protein PV07_00380 [Cladophialophora immunda]KIW33540.1 hypothetical protein PV07_00380 [Cladophialophora immunda]